MLAGDCIRCYQCRSDQRPDCGDPFFPGSVPSTECDNFYTTKTFVCHKTSTFGQKLNIIIDIVVTRLSLVAVGIGYITVRGCAPFNKDFFPAQMQQGMAGSYWSVSSSHIQPSECIHNDQCAGLGRDLSV